MSIELLQKAADAAGYAMAAPDDDAFETPVMRLDPSRSAHRAVALRAPVQHNWSTRSADTLAHASAWIKGHLPSLLGGRATA